MKSRRAVARVVAVILAVPVAIAVGIGATLLAAVLGHQALLITIGEEAIPAFDNTIAMRILVLGAYVAGCVAGIGVLIGSWVVVIRPRT
jgi:hypothetical protein